MPNLTFYARTNTTNIQADTALVDELESLGVRTHVRSNTSEIVMTFANDLADQVRELLAGIPKWTITEVDPQTNAGPSYKPSADELNATFATSQ